MDKQLSEDGRQRLHQMARDFRASIFPFFKLDRETDLGRAVRQAYVESGEIERMTRTDEENRAALGHSIGGWRDDGGPVDKSG